MIPDRDYYADKDGKLTEDPDRYASQVAVRGCFLDKKIAMRFGITDMLVSVVEPHAQRRVTGRNAASVQIAKAGDRVEKSEEKQEEPQEPAAAEEPKAEEPKAEAKKPAAKKGEKKK